MGGENALLQDVVGSVVIGNNECMGGGGGSGGREFTSEVGELRSKGAGCLTVLYLDVKVIRNDDRWAGGERDVRAKLGHRLGERQLTSTRRWRTGSFPGGGGVLLGCRRARLLGLLFWEEQGRHTHLQALRNASWEPSLGACRGN